MAAEVQIDLGVNTEGAQKTVKKFSDSAVKSLSSVESAFSSIKLIAGAAVAVIASQKIISFLTESAKAASESQDAVLRLNLALASTGEYTENASKKFQALAGEIQKQTGISDELILKQVALGKSYNLTNSQTEKLVKAAVELSAVTGDDLNTSTEKLAKTFNGFSDKTLTKMVPGFKNLTEQQLKNGAAIDIVLSKYEGLAGQLSNTFSGSIRKAGTSFDELLESVGRIIIENPAIIKVINKFAEALDSLGEYFKKNQVSISSLITNGLIILLKTLPYVIDVFVAFGQIVLGVTKDISFMVRDVLLLIGTLVRAASIITPGKFGKGIEELADDIAEATYNAGAFGVAAGKAFKDLDGFAKQTREASTKLVKEMEKMPPIVKKLGKEIKNLPQIKVVDKVALQKQIDEARAKLDKIFSDPINSIFRLDFEFNQKTLTAFFGGIFAAMGKGAQGAVEVISAGLGQGLATLLGSPELAGVFTEVFKILSKGPAEVKKLVNEFLDAIPTILENIILAIPEVIEAFADKFPEIIDRLVDRLPDIIEKLIEKMPMVAEKMAVSMAIKVPNALISAIPKIVAAYISRMGEALTNLFGDVGKQLLDGLAKIPETILRALSDGIGNIFRNIPGVGGLIGGGGGGLGGILNPIRDVARQIPIIGGLFSHGGMVPDGFENDSFKAQLSSGEMVIPRGDVDRLGAFLDRQQGLNEQVFSSLNNSGEKNLTVVLNVGESELAKVMLNLNRRGFRTA